MKLETKRLTLRYWQPSDRQSVIDGLNDLSVSRWLAFVPCPYTASDADQWISYCTSLSQLELPCSYEFAIEVKTSKEVVGGVSLNRVHRGQGTAGGGLWIASEHQGHGYGSEAFGEKIRFAFEDLKLRRLENGFFTGNEASWKLQQRFGFKIEGEKRKVYRCMADGIFKDECITGLLVEDWIKR